jgi:hypothetical protein
VSRVFETEYFVFDSEFLALQIGEDFDIGHRAADFLIDGLLQAAMTGPERIESILQRHGSSYPEQDEGC